jgi:hypothetical protein
MADGKLMLSKVNLGVLRTVNYESFQIQKTIANGKKESTFIKDR